MEHSTSATAGATDTAPRPPTSSTQLARGAIDDFLATPASLRCDPETIVFIEREQNRLSYGVSESVAEFDQWREWDHDGALSATAWIDTACHLPKKEARAELRRGKALSGLPSGRCGLEERRHRGRPRWTC